MWRSVSNKTSPPLMMMMMRRTNPTVMRMMMITTRPVSSRRPFLAASSLSYTFGESQASSCSSFSRPKECWRASYSYHGRRTFSYSSLSEPEPTLFARPWAGTTLFPRTDPTTTMEVVGEEPAVGSVMDDPQTWDAPLRQDIRVMGSMLGRIMREHDDDDDDEGLEAAAAAAFPASMSTSSTLTQVESMRQWAKTWRQAWHGQNHGEAQAAFAHLVDLANRLPHDALYRVSRAFTHFLALANVAEGHHRTRRLKQPSGISSYSSSGALYAKPDSCGGVVPALLQQGHSADEIWQALSTQTTEWVLTAHPTEVNRRTLLDKKRRIQQTLAQADQIRASLPPTALASIPGQVQYEMDQLDQALLREIAAIWLSDEVARTKPTPEEEAEKGTLVVETVLWEALPRFLRKLNVTMRHFLDGRDLPLSAAPLKLASWMGGDRDGNPHVRPRTTRLVTLRNRAKAARLYQAALEALQSELSMTTCSEALRARVGPVREPYRALIRTMLTKWERTLTWARQQEAPWLTPPPPPAAEGSSSSSSSSRRRLDRHWMEVSAAARADPVSVDEIYVDPADFRNDLMLLHASLCETGQAVAADGRLTDLLRQLSAFGLTLIPLDIRQESDRHEEAINAITQFLGLGSYSDWDEATKIEWLTTQITSNRPLLRPGVWYEHPDIFTPSVVDTLEISRMIADQHPGSLGAYVISQATHASDVLAVLLLQLDAGVKQPLRVVPLFETLGDLQGAVATMRNLFSLPAYMNIIQGKQEVMIGYSDSAKDAGRLAASWAQYGTQEALAQLAKEFNVDLTFFHGKGGTVGRGGNPQTFVAIMSHAPNTIKGHFRVTEQGEMINQNFGFVDRAERTMDIYTAAVLAEKLTPRPSPPQAWRDMMDALAEVSCDTYRQVVRGDSRFVPYFRSATPELELASLNIGSRPAKRKASGGVESLRAIPWNFAWTQTRSNLPTWLGVGTAIGACLEDEEKAPLLREMYRNFDSFRTMIDLVEMVLAKSEPAIAAHYEKQLVSDPLALELGAQIQAMHAATERAILELTGHSRLGENNRILQRSLAVRNPYVDCLNVLQVEALKRLRQKSLEAEMNPVEEKVLKDALLTTITGIANGMGNTG